MRSHCCALEFPAEFGRDRWLCEITKEVHLVMLRKAQVKRAAYVEIATACSDGDVLPQSNDFLPPYAQPFGAASSVLCLADISHIHCAFRDRRSAGSRPFGHAFSLLSKTSGALS